MNKKIYLIGNEKGRINSYNYDINEYSFMLNYEDTYLNQYNEQFQSIMDFLEELDEDFDE